MTRIPHRRKVRHKEASALVVIIMLSDKTKTNNAHKAAVESTILTMTCIPHRRKSRHKLAPPLPITVLSVRALHHGLRDAVSI